MAESKPPREGGKPNPERPHRKDDVQPSRGHPKMPSDPDRRKG